VAFGAYAYPVVPASRSVWAFQVDLFTELSKDLGSPADNAATPQDTLFRRYNDIDRTLGFNQLGYMRTWIKPARGWKKPGLQYQIWGAGGLVWDGIPSFLQNRFAHGLRKLTYVPRDSTVTSVVVSAGGDAALSWGLYGATFWRCCAVHIVPAIGVGTGLSTSFVEVGYGTAALNATITTNPSSTTLPKELLQLGMLVRKGFVDDPAAYDHMAKGLRGSYRMLQAWILLPPVGEWVGQSWSPHVRVVWTCSRGPFAAFRDRGLSDADAPDGFPLCPQGARHPGEAMIENFLSLRLEFGPQNFVIETWNDFGSKDLGPTFGLRVQKE
jgi:hypothetical protein